MTTDRRAEGIPPAPPADRQRRRLERARAALADRGVDGVLLYATGSRRPDPVRYLSGYVHVFPRAQSLLLLPADGDPVLLIDRDWHRPDAVEMSWVGDVRTVPPGFTRSYDALVAALGGALADAGLDGGRLGLPDNDLPAALRSAIDDAREPGADVRFVPSFWPELVATPTPDDVASVREAAAIADDGLAALVGAAGPGRTERAVALAALERLAERGAEFLHAHAVSTHVDVGAYSRTRSNLQPYLFTERELEPGTMFWVDLIVCHRGYYVDCDRTVAVGDPDPEQRALYDACRRMYRAMVDAVAPGVTGRAVWRAGRDAAVDAGYDESHLNAVYLGHTTGLTVSTRPVVAPDADGEIRAGQLLNVEPGLIVPGVGSACIENTLHVTADGVETLNAAPIDLQVA